MCGASVIFGMMRNAYKILVGRKEGKRSLGTCRHKWNIRER
jgi:hypothetical protein